MKAILNPVAFEATDHFLRLIRLRDRLRCPNCNAVGTWKPHGGYADRHNDVRHVRRWLCKWCGWYEDAHNQFHCVVSPQRDVWLLPADDPGDGTTPQDIIRLSEVPRVWPWRG